MYRVVAIILLFLVITSAAFGRSGMGTETMSSPQAVSPTLSVHTDAAPELSAQAYAVIDIASGDILFSDNAHTVLPIASITKLFTAAMVLESGRKPVTITAEDVATYGDAGKLVAGQEFSTYELLYPLLLESSNDAAAAIARTHGVPQQKEIFLADGSGLSPQNTASAAAIAQALQELYTAQPHIFDITRLPHFISAETGWVNNSPVRDLPEYRGGKHGYTPAAGKTLASVFAEESLDGRELGYVLLGSQDLSVDLQVLREAVAASVAIE